MIKHTSAGATSALMTYLLNHQADIANDVDDFADLYLIFYELIGFAPRKTANRSIKEQIAEIEGSMDYVRSLPRTDRNE